MLWKQLSACLALSAILAPAPPVAAQDWGDIARGVVEGYVRGQQGQQQQQQIIRQPQQQQRRVQQQQPRAPRPVQDPAVTYRNQQVQEALRYFGYYNGGIDGDLGPRSREAIARYQAQMGYNPVGELTDGQRNLLNGAYLEASARGVPGTSEYLRRFRDGETDVAGPTGAPSTTPLPLPTPEPQPPVFPDPSIVADTGPGFNDLCETVQMSTTLNNGYQTADALTDPALALSEQACIIRGLAAGQAPRGTAQEVAAKCGPLANFFSREVDGLASEPPAALIEQAQETIRKSGRTAAQIQGAAQNCLSGGYRDDVPRTTLASALVLVAAGQPAYAEVIGHHLNEGVGIAKSPALATAWYQMALDAIDGGSTPAFMPSQAAERSRLIRAATAGPAPATADAGIAPAATPTPLVLPDF